MQTAYSEAWEIRECFNWFDEDGDGWVEVAVVPRMLRALNVLVLPVHAGQIIEECGKKQAIELGEFARLYRKWRKLDGVTEEQLQEYFQVFGRGGNIKVAGLRHLMTCMGKKISVEDFDGLLRACELDNKEMINWQEFYLLFTGIKLGN